MSLCHSTDTRAPSSSVTIDVNGRLPGGIYAPEKDSVFVITPRGQQGFSVYVPAGIEMSYNENPSFKEESGGPSHWKAYCPEDLVLHELDAISNETLESPIIIRVHHGPNDYDTYNLAAGTLIQTALEHCPGCLSTAPNGMARHVSSERVDGQCKTEIGSAAGLGWPKASDLPTSIRIDATVFPSSEFITPEGDDYRCASGGDITVLGPPTGRGYFLVNPANGEIKVYEHWTTGPDRLADHGETAADGVPGRGKAFFIPSGRHHHDLVTVETPVIADEQNCPGHTIRTGDQTYMSNIPIPNKAVRGLRSVYSPQMMEPCESNDRHTEQHSRQE
jgi:hypothetical protein